MDVPELLATLPELDKEGKGLEFLQRPPFTDETKQQISVAQAQVTRRTTLTNAAISAIQALLDDGYPTPLSFKMSAASMAEIRKALDEESAAFDLFHSSRAMKGVLTFEEIP